jgi:hypothetical protein
MQNVGFENEEKGSILRLSLIEREKEKEEAYTLTIYRHI